MYKYKLHTKISNLVTWLNESRIITARSGMPDGGPGGQGGPKGQRPTGQTPNNQAPPKK